MRMKPGYELAGPRYLFSRGGRLRGPGYQQSQRPRHDAEFYRQRSQWLAVYLRINWIGIDAFAEQAIGFPEIDAFFLAQITHPQSRQIAEVLQAALRSEAQEFELVFKQVSFGRDLERATVVLGAANDHQGNFVGLSFAGNAKA